VSDELFPEVPVVTVVLAVEGWTTLVGIVSLEVFGHWRNTVLDPEQLFESAMRGAGHSIGLV
jgi:hypothetical protein